jgi:ankyrin repeat protein
VCVSMAFVLRACVPQEEGNTPLYTAAGGGHADVVAALIQYGADVNLASSNGATPLQAATMRGHRDVVELLLDAGAAPVGSTS